MLFSQGVSLEKSRRSRVRLWTDENRRPQALAACLREEYHVFAGTPSRLFGWIMPLEELFRHDPPGLQGTAESDL